jgi:hypothetical protein
MGHFDLGVQNYQYDKPKINCKLKIVKITGYGFKHLHTRRPIPDDEFNIHTDWQAYSQAMRNSYSWRNTWNTAGTYCYWRLYISAILSYWTLTLNLMPTFRLQLYFNSFYHWGYPSRTFHASTTAAHQEKELFSFCTAVTDSHGLLQCWVLAEVCWCRTRAVTKKWW